MKKSKSIRNIIIFSIVAVGCGYLGILIDSLNPPGDPMQGLGALIWLASPLVANILLRLLGGDGWKDFGIKPNFRKGWVFYITALLAAPVITLIILGFGTIVNAFSITAAAAGGLEAFIPLVAIAFVSSMFKNIFEEFSWRGYLTPRLEAIGVHPFLNSLITGFIWAGWHIPYYLYFLDRSILETHTSLNLPVFIALSFFLLSLQALAYGELRLASKSLWPVWIMHTIANAISLPLLSGGFISLKKGVMGVFFSPGSEGVLYALLMGILGLFLYRKRKRNLS